jgi:tetratricopeptide (TPR) repeat protein
VVDAQPEEAADLSDSAVSDSVVHEVDLSEEWAALSADPVEATPVAKDAGAADAYNGLISSLQGEVSAESSLVDEEPASVGAESVIETPPARNAAKDATEETPLLDVATDPLLQELLDEYEKALAVEDTAAPASDADSNQDLNILSAELDATLPGLIDSAAEAPRTPVESAEAVASLKSARQGPLGDVFDEFRADLDEGSEKEDPETHYNLGIAYREMGLIEEAISEFQKVASAHQKGQPFRYALQCYTLLALAFAEKGQPSIAVSWYERALQVPGLDPETVLALRYDLGVSQEMAGDVQAAHKSFSQVYGTNIDYRDVAERLAALGGNR